MQNFLRKRNIIFMVNIKSSMIIGLFGNPINHSLSPIIHKHFSKKLKIFYLYKTFLCTKKNFMNLLLNFLKHKNHIGANITVPFKNQTYKIFNNFLYHSTQSCTVNTLFKNSNSLIIGNNTDGLGLLYDLKRLKFLKPLCYILLLGSGGAAKSVISSLLNFKCIIYVLNRTISNAEKLVHFFSLKGKIFIFNNKKKVFFDLIINATSSSIVNESPFFPSNIIHNKICCYDMFYHKKNILTSFLLKCQSLGAKKLSDGLGMLVSQAAYSCLHWFGKMPNIKKTLLYMNQQREL